MNLHPQKLVIILTVLAVAPALYSSQASSYSTSSSASTSSVDSTSSNQEITDTDKELKRLGLRLRGHYTEDRKLVRLGTVYEYGQCGATKDIKRAIDYYEQAAKLSNAIALFRLGYIHYHATNGPKDLKRAHDYYLQAAQQESSVAQYELGLMYFNGIGTKKNLTKAFKWLLAAANSGDTLSTGFMYPFLQRGISIEKDLKKAAEFFENLRKNLVIDSASKNAGIESTAAMARHFIVNIAHQNKLPEPQFPVSITEVCTICCDSFEFGDEVVILPCNHCFCKECITPWITAHHTCPCCRRNNINPDQFTIGIVVESL